MTTDTWCVLCVPKVMLNGDNRYMVCTVCTQSNAEW